MTAVGGGYSYPNFSDEELRLRELTPWMSEGGPGDGLLAGWGLGGVCRVGWAMS